MSEVGRPKSEKQKRKIFRDLLHINTETETKDSKEKTLNQNP